MGVCDSLNNNKKQNNSHFNNNNNNNNKIENNFENNINNNNNSIINNLRNKFNFFLEKNPFFNYEIQFQKNLINELISKNFLSPFQFIQSKNLINENNNNFNNLFLLLFEICFLKCEPILTNLFKDDEKNKNLLFFSTSLNFLCKNENIENKNEIVKSFFILSYSQKEKKINKEYLKVLILNYSELCLEIILYLIVFPCLFNNNIFEENKNENNINNNINEIIEILNNNFLINEKYSKVEIDDFCFEELNKILKKNLNLENIINIWLQYIIFPLNINDNNNINNNNNLFNEFYINNNNSLNNNFYSDLTDFQKNQIQIRFIHMINYNNYIEIVLGNKTKAFLN